MLDSNSLEIISQFKQAVLSKKLPQHGYATSTSNRGNKLDNASFIDNLSTKVVEYNGVNHVVLTNECIERSNYKNKRSFYDTFLDEFNNEEDDYYDDDDEEGNESDDYDDYEEYGADLDDHPFKKLKICDILAPLNHPSEIITHPAISKTFKLTILHKLSSELINLIEIEQNTLNHLNKLLHLLNGEDWFYLLEQNLGLPEYDHGLDIKPDEKLSSQPSPAKPYEQAKIKQENEQMDPFFALPETLKKYDAHQQQTEHDDLTILKAKLTTFLQASIQLQYEYIKHLSLLRNGIVRADRLKRDLYKWGKEMHDKKSN